MKLLSSFGKILAFTLFIFSNTASANTKVFNQWDLLGSAVEQLNYKATTKPYDWCQEQAGIGNVAKYIEGQAIKRLRKEIDLPKALYKAVGYKEFSKQAYDSDYLTRLRKLNIKIATSGAGFITCTTTYDNYKKREVKPFGNWFFKNKEIRSITFNGMTGEIYQFEAVQEIENPTFTFLEQIASAYQDKFGFKKLISSNKGKSYSLTNDKNNIISSFQIELQSNIDIMNREVSDIIHLNYMSKSYSSDFIRNDIDKALNFYLLPYKTEYKDILSKEIDRLYEIGKLTLGEKNNKPKFDV